MFEPVKDRRRNWPRLIAFAALGIALAFVSGLHTASVVLERTAPQIASQLNPSNGRAIGRDAYLRLATLVADGKSNEEAAAELLPLARKAIRLEPLNVRAHVVAAWAAQASQKRQELLNKALKLNRRSRALQGLSLQERTQAGDLNGTIETLDQILRVHPETSAEFFPVLSTALADDQSLATFETILASSPPWQEQFLLRAAATKGSAKNASFLSQRLLIGDEGLDQVVIASLVGEGEWEAGRKHYDFAYARREQSQTGLFPTTFPPFDWNMADEREMRAQPSRDGSEIELFVKPGNGGNLLNRIVQAKGAALKLKMEYDIEPSSQLENVRLQAACVASQQVLLDAPLNGGDTQFQAAKPAANCDFVALGIYARVFRGNPAMRGTISRLTVN